MGLPSDSPPVLALEDEKSVAPRHQDIELIIFAVPSGVDCERLQPLRDKQVVHGLLKNGALVLGRGAHRIQSRERGLARVRVERCGRDEEKSAVIEADQGRIEQVAAALVQAGVGDEGLSGR
ncbi:hypothetical protein JL11_10995 [Brevundimonas sp. DS20]|nr:hypothetical protein JL11_10995 [Brevundimonas sp. DS20]